MTDTPILDAAIHAGCLTIGTVGCVHPACMGSAGLCAAAKAIPAALRAALPWEPPAETIEAMAAASYRIWFGEHVSPKWGEAVISKDTWRAAGVVAYRADPIIRELYPEHFV